MAASESDSLLEKLDTSKLKQFDAFPKLPSSYKTRSESRGILTLLVALAAFVLLLNDVSEWVWGWPDYEFGVSRDNAAYMDVNVDMIVNMPCQCKAVCFWLEVCANLMMLFTYRSEY
jgi:endoplasmic reticulum-Golgi intermediate compartment protein 2